MMPSMSSGDRQAAGAELVASCISRSVRRRWRHSGQACKIAPGTKASSGTGKNDRANAGFASQVSDCADQGVHQLARHGIALLRPVQK